VRLATKMPIWTMNSPADMDRCLAEQLSKLQTDHIDFYLLHGLNRERWSRVKNLNFFEWAEKAKDEDKIRYLGFSFHDDLDIFKEIIDSYDGWTFCQIQYNYMDADYQAGTRGLRYAASKGLGVVIMEPIGGGMLAIKPPPAIEDLWNEAKVKRTPAEWALQWVWNQPEVSLALSGMSTMQHVVENVESADRSGAGSLTEEELRLVDRVRQRYREYGFVGCTGCGYCQPCPQGVVIPQVFAFYNEYFMKNRDNAVVALYREKVPLENRVSQCIKCGQCETLCPQQLPIRDLLGRAAGTLERTG
jgi:predicted aldo/keto reductase-like oxidoreductase